MNNKTTSNKDQPTFAILNQGSLPPQYKLLAVEWEDICDNPPHYVIQYDRFNYNRWTVKESFCFQHRASCKSLSSAIRHVENSAFHQESKTK